MDTLLSVYQTIESLGIHRGGWLFVAILLLIPALVSGNMFIVYVSKVLNREILLQVAWKPLAANLATVIATALVIATAAYMYL